MGLKDIVLKGKKANIKRLHSILLHLDNSLEMTKL